MDSHQNQALGYVYVIQVLIRSPLCTRCRNCAFTDSIYGFVLPFIFVLEVEGGV